MAEANLQPVPQLVIDLGHHYPNPQSRQRPPRCSTATRPRCIEEMFDKVMTASSYSSALVTLWACTGCRYTLNGRPFDYLTCGHGTAERLIARGDVYPAGRAH